ncbi:unnamed protein product, partial [Tuber melanosporum]
YLRELPSSEGACPLRSKSPSETWFLLFDKYRNLNFSYPYNFVFIYLVDN